MIPNLQWHFFGKISLGHRTDYMGNFNGRVNKVGDKFVYRIHTVTPLSSCNPREHDSMSKISLSPNDIPCFGKFTHQGFVKRYDFVHDIAYFSVEPGMVDR